MLISAMKIEALGNDKGLRLVMRLQNSCKVLQGLVSGFLGGQQVTKWIVHLPANAESKAGTCLTLFAAKNSWTRPPTVHQQWHYSKINETTPTLPLHFTSTHALTRG